MLHKCVKKVKILITINIIIICNLANINIYAGQDCRSMLPAYLKPLFGINQVQWALEGTLAAGKMSDRTIANSMLMGGLNLNLSETHQFYFEGALKKFYNSKKGPGQNGEGSYEQFPAVEKKEVGAREAFYQFKTNNLKIISGLQTLKTNDYFLVDERVIGVNANYTYNENISVAATGATVMSFARYADFCGVRHLYNLTRGRRVNFLGKEFGESNFAMLVLKYKNVATSTTIKPQNETVSDADEFEEFTESNVSQKPNVFQEAGIVLYDEFGKIFPGYKYYGGFFSEFRLPFDINFKNEFLYQHVYKEKAVGCFMELSKVLNWANGHNTALYLSYYGKIEIDENTMFYPSYTNLFLGEVMKMDAMDLPIVAASARHNFNSNLGTYLKVQYAGQLHGSHTQELNVESGIKLFKHLKITGILGYIRSDKLTKDDYLGRLELRIAI